jgi:hypothetical protein
MSDNPTTHTTQTTQSAGASALIEVGGYVGAAFVIAGATAMVAPNWEDFSALTKLAILAGPALLLLICGYALAAAMPGGWAIHPGEQTGSRRRLVGVLVLAAGGLLAGASTVVLNDHVDRVWPLALLAFWGIGYLVCRGAVLHLAVGAALTWSIFATINPSDGDLRTSGAVLVAAAAGWAVLTALRLIDEHDLGYIVAGVMAFTGAEFVASDDPVILGYLLLAAIAVVGLGGYLRSRQLSALGVGAVTLAVVVPQAVIHYTDGSLGAAGALLVCGLSIVAASALGLRLHHAPSPPPNTFP